MNNIYSRSIDNRIKDYKTILKNLIIDHNNNYGEITLKVSSKKIVDVISRLHSNSTLIFDQLIDITAIDYPENVQRFEVVYLLMSTSMNERLVIKVHLKEGDQIPSVSNIFKSSLWSEREIWDMFGIFFSGHPDLRRILTDYGFEGHPLRKDFPLTGKVEVRYDSVLKRVKYEPVKLAQEFRDFDFLSPWETSNNSGGQDTSDEENN
tara:strand:+ start:46 stop:666 length:621 start_codon:yes stop_codon:yes gene_type:complete